MNKTKFFISLVLAVSFLIAQVGGVFAASALQDSTSIIGIVESITLETDPSTGVMTVIVGVVNQDQILQTVRLSQKTAKDLRLLALDKKGNGNLVINDLALGEPIEIDPTTVIPDQEATRHPIGNALATVFSDITDYDTIMNAHADGVGFGFIAQALWLTEMEGNPDVFQMILDAKESGDYSSIVLEDGIAFSNWGQLRKAILDGKKISSVGNVMSNKGNGNNQNNIQNNNKDKTKNQNKGKNENANENENGNQKKK
ncbi:MAG TPA: hypothetical protein VK206_23800 [Anaerolineales bacterium]|nr:hypothetical protein [Anaerolineales bacterium]